jgi:DNA-binding NarL/FixJ family response regulator
MGSYGITIAIIAPPGPIRDGLQALLASISRCDRILVLDGAALSRDRLDPSRPDVALIDAGPLDTAIGQALQHIRSTWPQARCLVLVDDVDQRATALAAGAAGAFLKDGRADELASAVERLIASSQRAGASSTNRRSY